MRPARELPCVRKSSTRMAAARSAETPSLAWRNSSMLRFRAGPRPVLPGYSVSSRSAAEGQPCGVVSWMGTPRRWQGREFRNRIGGGGGVLLVTYLGGRSRRGSSRPWLGRFLRRASLEETGEDAEAETAMDRSGTGASCAVRSLSGGGARSRAGEKLGERRGRLNRASGGRGGSRGSGAVIRIGQRAF